MGRAHGTNGGEEQCILVIDGKDREKEARRKPILSCADNIKMDHGEIRCGSFNWIGIAMEKD
jgi:hypothetical protein